MILRLLKRIFIYLVCAGFLSSPALASVDTDLAYWNLITLNKNLNSKFRAQLITSQRWAELLSDFNTNLVRTGLGYNLTNEISIWQGYDWFSFYDGEMTNEHRIWQQLLYQKNLGKWLIINRTRLEERLLEDNDAIVRLRNLSRVDYRLKQKLRLIAGAEIFVNLKTNDAIDEILDQNRLLTGIGYDVNSNVAIDLIYMLQHNNRDTDSLNHTVVSNLIFSF
jgi:hypothetical protein